MSAAPLPAALTGLGSEKRAELWLERFRDLCERNGDLEVIHRELFAALTEPVISIRVPDSSSPRGWNYKLMADAGTRITAARLLLAYLAGLPPSQADVRIQHVKGSAPGPQNVAGMLEELEAIGVGITELTQDIRRQAERATPIEIDS